MSNPINWIQLESTYTQAINTTQNPIDYVDNVILSSMLNLTTQLIRDRSATIKSIIVCWIHNKIRIFFVSTRIITIFRPHIQC